MSAIIEIDEDLDSSEQSVESQSAIDTPHDVLDVQLASHSTVTRTARSTSSSDTRSPHSTMKPPSKPSPSANPTTAHKIVKVQNVAHPSLSPPDHLIRPKAHNDPSIRKTSKKTHVTFRSRERRRNPSRRRSSTNPGPIPEVSRVL